MSSTVSFWDRVADRYARSPIKDQAAYEHKLALTQQYLRPHMQVLELGCGTGGTALAHAPHVREILATDLSARMIEIARDRAQASRVDNVVFRRMSLDEQPTRGDQDAVLALNLLHLLPDWREALASIHGMLKPGGIFVSSTVCLGDDMPWLRPVLGLMRLLRFAPKGVQFLHEEDLINALRNGGFRVLEHWRPGPRSAHFIVARRLEET